MLKLAVDQSLPDTITWPPALVNLMALERRLSRICLSRRGSATTAGRLGASEVRSTMRSRLASGCRLLTQSSTSSGRSTAVKSRSNLPASILEMSSRSLSRLKRIEPALMDVLDIALVTRIADRRRTAPRSISSVKPRIELSGVRTSWLTLARKSSRRATEVASESSVSGSASADARRPASAAVIGSGSCDACRR